MGAFSTSPSSGSLTLATFSCNAGEGIFAANSEAARRVYLQKAHPLDSLFK